MRTNDEDLVIGDEYHLDHADKNRTGIYVGVFDGMVHFYPTSDDDYYTKEADGTIRFPIKKYEYEEV
ncbi:MAG: hypothetical protein ACYC5G_04045 [Candidatus Doudnabacteria bacterium]